MAKSNESPKAVASSEETIAGYLRDVKRNIQKVGKGMEALAALGNDETIVAAKNALNGRKEKLAKAAGQRVFDYLMKVE